MLTNDMPAAAERRRHPRTQMQMTLGCIRLDPDGGDVTDKLHLTDISRGGLGALTDRPYYPGQRILLNMPLTACGGRRNIYAAIVRCKPDSEGYHIGLQFDNVSFALWAGGSLAAPAVCAA